MAFIGIQVVQAGQHEQVVSAVQKMDPFEVAMLCMAASEIYLHHIRYNGILKRKNST